MKPFLLLAIPVLALSSCVVDEAGGAAGATQGQGAFQKTIGPGMVSITESGNTVSIIRTAAPNIEAADFTGPGQEQIAIKSRGAHGPATVELFDTRSGKRLGSVMAYEIQNGQPAWAARYAE